MRCPATMDRPTRRSTLVFLTVWLGVMAYLAWLVATLEQPAARLLVAASALPGLALVPLLARWRPLAYELDGTGLRILRRAGAVEIPLGAIQGASLLDDGLRLRRDFGVGGLFGHFGRFSAPGIGRLTLYATRVTGRVALRTDRGTVVLTPEPAAGFIAELERLRAR